MMSSVRRRLFNVESKEDYYVSIPCNFKQLIEDAYFIEPLVHQPLAPGAEILARRYNNKYSIRIEIVDQSEIESVSGDNLNSRFEYFIRHTLPTLSLANNQAVGYILMHGTNHAVPVLISMENDKKYFIIFDSTSGPRVKAYHFIANLLSDYTVLINSKSRQADNGSCVTDALVVLKDALRITNIGEYLFANKLLPEGAPISPVKENASTSSDSSEEKRISPVKKLLKVELLHNNFRIFRMPEKLLKTAQVSAFVEAADPDFKQVIGKNGVTLKQRRENDVLTVTINKGKPITTNINSFLYNKSRKHAALIDAEIARRNKLK